MTDKVAPESHTQKVIDATLAEYDRAIEAGDQELKTWLSVTVVRLLHEGVGPVETVQAIHDFVLRLTRRAVEQSVTLAALRMQEGWIPKPP